MRNLNPMSTQYNFSAPPLVFTITCRQTSQIMMRISPRIALHHSTNSRSDFRAGETVQNLTAVQSSSLPVNRAECCPSTGQAQLCSDWHGVGDGRHGRGLAELRAERTGDSAPRAVGAVPFPIPKLTDFRADLRKHDRLCTITIQSDSGCSSTAFVPVVKRDRTSESTPDGRPVPPSNGCHDTRWMQIVAASAKSAFGAHAATDGGRYWPVPSAKLKLQTIK